MIKIDYRRFGDKYIVRLDKGDEILSSIEELIKKEDIRLGEISGLGAISQAEIGIFDLESQLYHKKLFEGIYEIANLYGNISTMKGMPYIHSHIIITDKDMLAYGGHLNKGIIGITGEIIIKRIDGEIDRQFNDKLGINEIIFK